MLCLTDMWRAAGSDPSKEPAIWRRQAATTEFVDYLGSILTINQDEAFQTVRGGSDPGTWAHWQIGLAYAKYLSPEFHAWCNTVVRNHMERRGSPNGSALNGRATFAS